MNWLVACFVSLVFAGSVSASQMIDGLIVSTHDGDTVTLLDRNYARHRIRLASIDAPEVGRGSKKPGQPYSQQSELSLASLTFNREVRAICEAEDRYGRKVCTIMVGSLNANLEQVRLGMAMAYRKYARDQIYFTAEAEAKAARRGLWGDPSPIEPWAWRKRHAAE